MFERVILFEAFIPRETFHSERICLRPIIPGESKKLTSFVGME